MKLGVILIAIGSLSIAFTAVTYIYYALFTGESFAGLIMIIPLLLVCGIPLAIGLYRLRKGAKV